MQELGVLLGHSDPDRFTWLAKAMSREKTCSAVESEILDEFVEHICLWRNGNGSAKITFGIGRGLKSFGHDGLDQFVTGKHRKKKISCGSTQSGFIFCKWSSIGVL